MQSGRVEEDIHIPIGIGEGSQIKKAIIDKNVRIGKNVKVSNSNWTLHNKVFECAKISTTKDVQNIVISYILYQTAFIL